MWQSAQEFQWKSQAINKNEWFSIISEFLWNRRILHCFHCRYEFCLQKYPGNCFMTFFDNLLKSFSENLKQQLTKMNDFLLFLRFHENHRILSCFHCRYEFCMQKYHSKCIIYWISIEGTISANFIKGYSLAIHPIFSKIWKFLILLYLSSFPSKNNIWWLFVTICSRVSVKISNN